MSVYTSITETELNQFLTNYEVGELIHYQGILAGIENTNYFVTTTQGEYVLTIFEQHEAHELPFFLQLMDFWAKNRIPTAQPIASQSQAYVLELKSKPAALVTRLAGTSSETPTLQQCYSIGRCLAQMHVAGEHSRLHRTPDRGHTWRMQIGERLLMSLSPDDQELLCKELDYQSQIPFESLPAGLIHADLFRDNALFDGEQLTGVIDLYYACNDSWLYDLAVLVNDWSINPDGSFNLNKISSCLRGYQAIRKLSPLEKKHTHAMLRAAALRFWLSRHMSKKNPPNGELTFLKSPDEYKLKLQHIIEHNITIE